MGNVNILNIYQKKYPINKNKLFDKNLRIIKRIDLTIFWNSIIKNKFRSCVYTILCFLNTTLKLGSFLCL